MSTLQTVELTKPSLETLRNRAREDERKSQKDKTLQWISSNALETFRRSWARQVAEFL